MQKRERVNDFYAGAKRGGGGALIFARILNSQLREWVREGECQQKNVLHKGEGQENLIMASLHSHELSAVSPPL